MVTMKGRRGWSGKSSRESLITMGWLPTGQTVQTYNTSSRGRDRGSQIEGSLGHIKKVRSYLKK
jgi:hypothetical protein